MATDDTIDAEIIENPEGTDIAKPKRRPKRSPSPRLVRTGEAILSGARSLREAGLRAGYSPATMNSPKNNGISRDLAVQAAVQSAVVTSAPEDATTLARASLQSLRGKIRRSIASGSLGGTTRAHLDETLARIDAALDAQMKRDIG